MESKAKSSKNNFRTRNWTFIVYPDSAPPEWRQSLDALHEKWVESPLHDSDVVEDGSGELKKPHWHVFLQHEGKKSYEQIKVITEMVCGTIPQEVSNAKGLVRYFAHLDNPEKHQYSASGIIGHGGADVAELLRPTSADRYRLIGEMCAYVDDNGITEFYQLTRYARQNRQEDWFPLLCDSCAYFISQYIKSVRHWQHDK